MSENRLKSLERLQKGSTADVILVSPANLDDWIVPSYPLHSAYENLSLIHRSDYLRAYFAYHHGGGYADLKPIEGNLGELIDKINSSSSLWGAGMKELGSHNVGSALGGKLPREQRANFSRHVYASCFAFRPNNPFTGEWLSEVETRLNYFEPLLGQ